MKSIVSQLKLFFEPNAIAIIGASRTEGKLGNNIVKNLLEARFKGKIFPVNPKATEILGLETYPSVKEIPEKVDLAVIIVPANVVPQVLEECGEKDIRAVVIESAGFSEINEEGKKLEQQVVEIAKKHGIRIIGPNCVGHLNTANNLNTSFARLDMPTKGGISFVAQSGAFAVALVEWMVSEGIGVSKFISVGNKCDVDDADLIEYLAHDDQTKVITLYIEGVKDGRKFMNIAKEVTRVKPILVLKAGRSIAGARAAASHTGALAGQDRVYDAVFKQCGIIRARDSEELFDLGRSLAYQPLPPSDGVAIVTNAGGPAVMAADVCEEYGLKLAKLENITKQKISIISPPWVVTANPVDLSGDCDTNRFTVAMKSVLDDPNVGGVIAIATMRALIGLEVVGALIELNRIYPHKPFSVALIGKEELLQQRKQLEKENVPAFPSAERAARAIAALFSYKRFKEKVGTV